MSEHFRSFVLPSEPITVVKDNVVSLHRKVYDRRMLCQGAEQSQIAMQKQFAIRKGVKLQFSTEAFNLTSNSDIQRVKCQ